MITCPICDYHYSEKRTHCPTCGYCRISNSGHWNTEWISGYAVKTSWYAEKVVAKGAERARQLPQSPRFFSTVDERG